jgi:hypothetical protein
MPTDYTPAGGTRAVATWTDADGNVCAPVDAVHAEIIEYDADGFELARTYMEPLEPGQVEVASNERMSEVHTPLLSWDQKSVWDVRNIETQELIETLPGLAEVFGWNLADPATSFSKVTSFITLPSFAVAPEPLRQETFAWLTSNKPG